MSFFQPLPPTRPPQERPREDWMGPPPGWLGGFVPVRPLLARTERIAITLGPLVAFSTGVEFELTTIGRLPTRVGWPTEGGFRLGVIYADGRKWQDAQLALPPHESGGPRVLPLGGGGGESSYTQRYWLWPLPPPGPLTIVLAWPQQGVPETQIELDGVLLQTAASQAQRLWDPPTVAELQAARRALHDSMAELGGSIGSVFAYKIGDSEDADD